MGYNREKDARFFFSLGIRCRGMGLVGGIEGLFLFEILDVFV